MDYKVLLDANNLRSTCQHGRPGKWAAIVIQDEYNESPYEAYEYIYAPVCVCALHVGSPPHRACLFVESASVGAHVGGHLRRAEEMGFSDYTPEIPSAQLTTATWSVLERFSRR